MHKYVHIHVGGVSTLNKSNPTEDSLVNHLLRDFQPQIKTNKKGMAKNGLC